MDSTIQQEQLQHSDGQEGRPAYVAYQGKVFRGKISSIEPNVMADPPRKPESNYGSRPI